MGKLNYIKYNIDNSKLLNLISNNNYKNVIFYIDLSGISTGFYSKEILFHELNRYVEKKEYPTLFIDNLRDYMNGLYKTYKAYNPKFVIFYDVGGHIQNTSISSTYKANRADRGLAISVSDESTEVLKCIKEYYFSTVAERFTKPNLSSVVFLQKYESDFVPHFIRSEGLLGSADKSVLNVILAKDKDLVQTCSFPNVVQCATNYKRQLKEYGMFILDNTNGINYIIPKLNDSKINVNFIPLILAIGGDIADNIDNVPGIGHKRAADIIIKHNMEYHVSKHTVFPDIIAEYYKMILKNYKLTSFNEQITRIPDTELNKLKSVLNFSI